MTTPRIEIDLGKISHNATSLRETYASKGIGIIAVTKAVCGDPAVADVLLRTGIDTLADSRLENIKRMRQAGVQAQFVLLRSPAPSQAESVVKYAGISLNTELSVIEALSRFAVKTGVTHKIILMVELGDLREGLLPGVLEETVEQVIGQRGIFLAGIGTNLACFGGVKPDEENLDHLSSLARDIEAKFGMTLQYVSGGNSANYDWFMSTTDVGKINNLRLGESIFLGCETLHRKQIPGLFTNALKLVAEVIESKVKPSKPCGDIGQDAFGNVPYFSDRGQMRRVILGIGLQDVLVAGLTPCIDIDILGASSDHILIDAKELDLKVGDEVDFNLNYGALLSAMTSPYVAKCYCAGSKTESANVVRAQVGRRRLSVGAVPPAHLGEAQTLERTRVRSGNGPGEAARNALPESVLNSVTIRSATVAGRRSGGQQARPHEARWARRRSGCARKKRKKICQRNCLSAA